MPIEPAELWDQADDWTGVTSAKERRRRQNRLHQRTYRAKKRKAKFPIDGSSLSVGTSQDDDSSSHAIVECSSRSQQQRSQFISAMLRNLPMLLLTSRHDAIHEKAKDFLQQAYTNWSLKVPRARDLPYVTRLTTFDALARNALLLQIPFEYLETDEHSSLFNVPGPEQMKGEPRYPDYLQPTALQKAVTHHSWLDLFPIPGMRDNILRGIEAGQYDEDELCDALCCDLLDFDTRTQAAIIVWGESWDASSWEFSIEFFAKWGTLLKGCPEVLDTTNSWRQRRGEGRILLG